MSTIELRSLTKRFHRLVAVNDVDLAVGAGEVVCLLGPSGCGKTTTLRMIAGLEAPSSGDVLIAGKRVNGLRTRDRNIAMVFQFYALYPTQTVAENLAYPLHVDRLPPAEFAKRIEKVSAALQLGHILDRVPGQLSEGEKQRVAVGRAIIRDPTCFLFDEPLSRLDVQLRETMRGQIKEILTGLNRATVIVTHDQLEALTMADRIAVMRGGVIEQSATPHDIFNKPINLFVASFIGTPQMNLIPAILVGPAGNGGWRFRIGEQTAAIATDPAVGRLAAGASVTLGIRPRNIDLIAGVADDGLAATVDLIEPMGAETLLHLIEGGQDLRVVVDARLEPRVGDKLRLRFRPGQTHVFDQSERRVAS